MPCLGHRPGLRAGPGFGWNAFAGRACACLSGALRGPLWAGRLGQQNAGLGPFADGSSC